MGPKGMAAGGIVGGALGLFAGVFTVGMLKLSGTTMEEARYWQYKWKTDRENAYREGFDNAMAETGFNPRSLMQDLHDEKVGTTKQNLYALPDEPETTKESKPEVEKEEVKKAEENVRKSEEVKEEKK
jgi:hypothetical protein